MRSPFEQPAPEWTQRRCQYTSALTVPGAHLERGPSGLSTNPRNNPDLSPECARGLIAARRGSDYLRRQETAEVTSTGRQF